MWKVAVAAVSVIGLILWNHARSRAKRKGSPFTITPDDIRDVSGGRGRGRTGRRPSAEPRACDTRKGGVLKRKRCDS
jgi:hypothetical protein